MKVSLEQIEATLLERKVEPPKVQEILKDLQQAADEEKADREANAEPKVKWEYVIVLDDKDELLKGKEIAGWVVQQKEGQDAGLVLSKLADAAKNQNESATKKKLKITTLVELFDALKSKWLKEKGVRIKTKELTRVLITNGKVF